MRTFKSILANREGTSALEFAIIAPLFFLALFTLVAYGIYLSVAHSVQQIAADAARTAVAGLSEAERRYLVDRYLQTAALDGSFLNRRNMTVVVSDDAVNTDQFTVRISYNSGDLPIWKLFTFALPQQKIERHSTIRLGGI